MENGVEIRLFVTKASARLRVLREHPRAMLDAASSNLHAENWMREI